MQPTSPSFDPARLRDALHRVPAGAWAQPVIHDDVNPGYQFATLIQAERRKPAAALFDFVLTEFAPVWTAWLAKVPAGSWIAPHVDQGPYHERWHVPIIPAGGFDGRDVTAGLPFPVAHWQPHRVDNPTLTDRIHLVIDRTVMVDVPDAPFQRIEDP